MALLGGRLPAALSTFLIVARALQAQAPLMDEYQVKALFLFNFAKFVEWPPHAFGSAHAPFKICVLGDNPFGEALADAVRGKTVSGRGFVVEEISKALQAPGCHIVFSNSFEGNRKSMLVELNRSGALTIGEGVAFIKDGGMISFKLVDSRVRFEIDAAAAAHAHLKISSKLLRLAENARNQP